MMRRAWHLLKALAVVGAMVCVFLGVQLAADRQWLPGWQTILTRPVGELIAYGPSRDNGPVPAEVVTTEIVPAPQLTGEPLRVAGRPAGASDGGEAGSTADPARSRDTAVRHEAQAVVTRPDPQLAATRDEPRLNPPKTARKGETAESLSSHAGLSTVEAGKQLADLLATGGDLVRAGVRLPRLIADWSLEDIEALARRGEGLLVAEGQGRLYRVALDGRPLLNAQDFTVLTPEARKRISNRGVCLNCDGTATAPSPFIQLEQEFLRQVGATWSGHQPRITFFPSSAFDSYLASKQLGAIASAGIDLSEQRSITTVGAIVLTLQGARYLIREIRLGDSVFPWDDPEAVMVTFMRRAER